MPSAYPAGYDTLPDPPANLSGPPLHSTIHNSENDAIEAIQHALGLNPSGADATVAAALAALAGRYVSVPTAWVGVTFTGTWVNFGAPYANCEYRKIGDMVYTRGVCKSGTINTALFTLPAGFRPPLDLLVPTTANLLPCWATIQANGVVIGSSENSNASVTVNFAFSTV